MLHLCKLAVGVRDPGHLAQIQKAAGGMPRCRTRNMPRRADEILAGGSLYWVVAGLLSVRQRVLRIAPDQWDDGTPCAGLFLDAVLVPVAPRLVKAFQGWRYLPAADAPADLPAAAQAMGQDALPFALQRALQELCLL